MTLIVDAGALFANADPRDPHHSAVISVLDAETEALVTSQFVAAEADYFILRRLGIRAEAEFVRDLAVVFITDGLTSVDIGRAHDVIKQYADLRLGIADASLVVLAEKWETRRILTLDERVFRAVTPLQGGSFDILPRDKN